MKVLKISAPRRSCSPFSPPLSVQEKEAMPESCQAAVGPHGEQGGNGQPGLPAAGTEDTETRAVPFSSSRF